MAVGLVVKELNLAATLAFVRIRIRQQPSTAGSSVGQMALPPPALSYLCPNRFGCNETSLGSN
jgi:hypothetical protein